MSDNENNEFKRAEPKPVPDDWKVVGKLYRQAVDDFYESEEAKLIDDPRAQKFNADVGGWSPPEVFVIPTKQEAYSFFETAIAHDEVAKIYFNPETDWDKLDSEGCLSIGYERLYLRYDFLYWWINTQSRLPIFVHRFFMGKLSYICNEAVFQCLKSGDVEASYRMMDEDFVYLQGAATKRLAIWESKRDG